MDSERGAYEYLCELDLRSQAHAPGLPQDVAGEGAQRWLAYRIGAHQLLSLHAEVAEILTLPETTPVPGGLPWLLGLANVRGNLLPVVDLKMFLEGERTVLHGNQRMLSVLQEGGDVAVLIDELFGQRTFSDKQSVSPSGTMSEGRYVHFIQRAYEAEGDTWGVFDLSRLVRTPEFKQAAA